MTIIRWSFPEHVPVLDLFEDRDLADPDDLQQALDDFLNFLEGDVFVSWEAVIRHEQGLPLSDRLHEAYEDAVSFGEGSDEPILYIDELPRPDRPWYEIVRRLAPHLRVQPFRTEDSFHEVYIAGWSRLAEAIEEHTEDLSLPEGVASADEVVLAPLRHALWLQWCFEPLIGLGDDPEAGLRDSEEEYRVEELLGRLRQHHEAVAALGLTLDGLDAVLILPAADREILRERVTRSLGLSSPTEPLAPKLEVSTRRGHRKRGLS